MRRHLLRSTFVLTAFVFLGAEVAQACTAQAISQKFNAAVGLPASTPPKVMKASQKKCVCAAESKKATIACLQPAKKQAPVAEGKAKAEAAS